MSSRWLLGLLILVFLGAFALRAPLLDLRPMHGDEAVHAVKFNALWAQGQYHYDPREYHGPTLYDFAIPLAQLSGAHTFAQISATTLRLVSVCFGTLLVGALWLIRDGFGKSRAPILWAAILTALSPVMVFYSRYFIQEILLVFFTFGFIACLWRARQSDKPRIRKAWLLGAALSLGLMLATKETAIIALTCIGVAWFFTLRSPNEITTIKSREWLLIALCGLATAALLLSNFGRSFPDLKSAIVALETYVSRAGTQEAQGELHRHPWYQYFEWLLWYRGGPGPRLSEAFIAAFALIGLGAAFRREVTPEARANAPLARFFAIYTLAMMAIYSAIPYKTPWCVLGFWHGAILLAGFGISEALALPQRRFASAWGTRMAQGAVLLICLGGCWNLLQQVHLSNERLFADRRNPWVYAHSTRDVMKLGERVQRLAALHPQKNALPVAVIAPGMDYWPLPWELRAQTQVGFFAQPPDVKAAYFPLVIAAKPSLEDLQHRMGSQFERGYHVEYYGLRPGIVFGLCVEQKLWKKFLAQPK